MERTLGAIPRSNKATLSPRLSPFQSFGGYDAVERRIPTLAQRAKEFHSSHDTINRLDYKSFTEDTFMIMADILKIFLIIVGLLTVYVSYWLVAQALFPGMVERARQHYAKPVKITVIGLLAAALPIILGAAISNLPNPAFKLTGVTLMLIPAMLGMIGSAGLALRIGVGLPAPGDDQQPWRRVLRGGILLALTFLLPFVGWIVLPVWALISGFGAFILSVKEARRANVAPPTINFTPAQGTA